MTRWRWLILSLVIAANLGCALGFAWVYEWATTRIWEAILNDRLNLLPLFVLLSAFGWLAGQVALLAAWWVLVPGRALLRTVCVWLLAALFWYALILGLKSSHPLIQPEEILNLGNWIGTALVLDAVVLLPLRSLGRWRLLPPGTSPGAPERQFSVRELFFATAAAGLVLGLARVLLPDNTVVGFVPVRQMLETVGWSFALHTLVALPCVWCAFLRRGWLEASVLLWPAWLAVVIYLTGHAWEWVYGVALDPETSAQWANIGLAQGVAVASTMLLLRGLGFRLVRREKEAG